MRIQRMLGSLIAILVIVFGPFIAIPQTAEASTPLGSTTLIINGGGGKLLDGSDGQKIVINANGSGEQLVFANKGNYYNDTNDNADVTFVLAIGSNSFGTRNGKNVWTSKSVLALDGTASITGTSGTGSGYALLEYTADVEGLIYIVQREIIYTYPNRFFLENFTVTIPAGNTEIVKLYKGGDTEPGGSDFGVGTRVTTPVETILSVEPTSKKIVGFRELVGGTFDGRYSSNCCNISFINTIKNGGDIGTTVNESNHDTEVWVQFTLGSTPGEFTRSLYTLTNFQAVTIEASFADTFANQSTTLDLLLSNTKTGGDAETTGIGFTFSLPSPMTVSGGVTNACGGTVTATVGSSTITVSGISLAALSTCNIAVPVSVPSPTSVTISSGSVTAINPDAETVLNSVGSSTVNFTFGSPTATRTLIPSATRTPSNTPLPSNTATRTATSSPTATNTFTPTSTFTPTNTFTPTPHPFAIKDVAVGASFTLAVLHNGTLATWGFNRDGQASLPRWMATKLVDQVETGSNYAIVLGRDGRVYGWGKGDFGQLKIPTAATSGVRSISAGLSHVMAIKNNGSLVIWGRNDFKQTEAPLAARNGLTAVAAGHSHSLAVKNGKVIAWGRNTWGQTRVPSNLSNVTAVAGGFDHSLALRSNGTVVCWGRNNENQCKIPANLKDVVAISAGVGYSMAMTRDGNVFAWGRSNFGQANVPNGIGKAGAISAGYVNSVIGLRDANVVAFGNSALGALVSRTPTVTP